MKYRVSERETEEKTKRVIVYRGFTLQMGAVISAEPGASSVSATVIQGPKHLVFFCCFPRSLSKEPDGTRAYSGTSTEAGSLIH